MNCKELAEILMKVHEQRHGLEVSFSTGDREQTAWGVDCYGAKYVADPDYHTDFVNKRFVIRLCDLKYQEVTDAT